MKKVITSITIALLPFAAIVSNVHAQDLNADRSTETEKQQAITASLNKPVTKQSTTANLINSSSKSAKEVKKAAREFRQFNKISNNFDRAYQGATNVSWKKEKSGYSCSFNYNGLQNLAFYNNGGSLHNSMVSYDEHRLDEDVKSIIKDAYRDYKIVVVNEVHQGNIVVYAVTIENDKNIKVVTVCEGELNIYEEYRKG
jgi:hypothetical protein